MLRGRGTPALQSGMNLIELMVTVAVLVTVIMIAIPSFQRWLSNTQMRTSAETLMAGLQLARSQAIVNNRSTGFFLVSSLDDSCSQSSMGPDWVVAVQDPTAKCGAGPSPDVEPRILQKKAGAEGGRATSVAAKSAGNDVSAIRFNAVGRLLGLSDGVDLDIRPASGEACEHEGGDARCLRVQIALGGGARLCDPKVNVTDDPRKC